MMGKVIMSGIVPHLVAPKKPGIALADIAEGSIVKINENGSPVQFFVAKHDYESSRNGTGRTLLVRKAVYGGSAYLSSSGGNGFHADTLIYSALNTTYKSRLDFDVPTTNLPEMNNVPVFLLSPTELGLSKSPWHDEEFIVSGSLLPTAPAIRATLTSEDSAVANCEWSRVVYGNSGYMMAAMCQSYAFNLSNREIIMYRPCFTLPSTALFDTETLILKGVV